MVALTTSSTTMSYSLAVVPLFVLKSIVPFIVSDIFLIGLVMLVPGIALWLPNMMFK